MAALQARLDEIDGANHGGSKTTATNTFLSTSSRSPNRLHNENKNSKRSPPGLASENDNKRPKQSGKDWRQYSPKTANHTTTNNRNNARNRDYDGGNQENPLRWKENKQNQQDDYCCPACHHEVEWKRGHLGWCDMFGSSNLKDAQSLLRKHKLCKSCYRNTHTTEHCNSITQIFCILCLDRHRPVDGCTNNQGRR